MNDKELKQRLSQLEEKIADVKQQLNRIEVMCTRSAKVALTMDDAAAYTGLSKSYLYRLVCHKAIPFYKSYGGKQTYFKKSELDNWLLLKRQATTEELELAAASLSMKKRGRKSKP